MSGTENFNDYPKHPGQTTPRPYYVEIPLETFETMSEELAELRKHKLSWDLDKARIKELEAENESLKYSVATLDTDIAMMKRWRKVSEEKPETEGDYLVMARYPDDDELHIEICLYDIDCEDFGHYERRYAESGNFFGGFDGEEWVTHNVSFWMPLPSAPKEADK